MDSASDSFDVYHTESIDDQVFKETKKHDKDHGVKEMKKSEKDHGGNEMKTKKGKDEWQVTDEALIRHHHRSRKGLFAPTGMDNVPVDLEELTGKRKTEIIFEDGSYQTKEDNYQTSKKPHEKLAQMWTGKTILFRKPSTCEKMTPKRPEPEEDDELDVLLTSFEEQVLRAAEGGRSRKLKCLRFFRRARSPQTFVNMRCQILLVVRRSLGKRFLKSWSVD